ncbi:hypothetical protein B6N60_03800 [Richelia sinica FACHB-800]|uniref:Uncharacterized protein n=1 Tax=Richelia sinica FACHB-800 TaxID=1357546 RepID=A0A975TAF9_9NOST|nr:hypothetical protein B6N60_03800 [Richelia sinica FACHB-800]
MAINFYICRIQIYLSQSLFKLAVVICMFGKFYAQIQEKIIFKVISPTN